MSTVDRYRRITDRFVASSVKMATEPTTAKLVTGYNYTTPYLGGFSTGGSLPTLGGTTYSSPGGTTPTFGNLSPYQSTVIEGLAGGAQDACEILPPILKEACKAAAGKIFGGGNGTTQYQPGGTPAPCPSGTIRVGSTCVAPGDVFPGGDPFTFPAGGGAVQGAFGLPAVVPAQSQRTRLLCPTGMVLGKDNLCYPKQVLPRRSKWRKWRPEPRPKISAAEWKTLKRAKRVKDEAREVAREAGYKVTNR